MIEKSTGMQYAGETNEGAHAGLRPCGRGGDQMRPENHKSSHNKPKVKTNLPRKPGVFISALSMPRASTAALVYDTLQSGSTNRFRCNKCGESTLHRKQCFSIHCRAPEDIVGIYTSVTCQNCGLESSPCPNKGAHPNSQNCLQWAVKDSEYTSEKVWELKCKHCLELRSSYIQSKKNSQDRGENIKLSKLTVKWTRCNNCFALYKKGKGATGVYSRERCKILDVHAAATNSPKTLHSRYTCICEQMLSLNIFRHLPENLRKKIVAQCETP